MSGATMSGATGKLEFVSCSGTGFCMAAGENGSSDIVDVDVNGTWTTSHPALGTLSGLSCASPTDCIAIENLGKNAEAWQYSGTSWKVVLRQSNAKFASVACAAAGRCTIVGSQSSAHLLDVIAGSTTTAIDVTGPGAAQAGFDCTSDVFCVGVNSVGETPTIPTAAVYNGHVWAKSNIGSESFDTFVYDVACGSSVDCFATGSGDDNLTPFGTVLEHFNGARWSAVTSPDPVNGFDQLLYVTCAARSRFCSSVGVTASAPAFHFMALPLAAGSAWSWFRIPNLTGQTPAVSCSASNSCVAAGWTKRAGGTTTYVETWNGKVWAAN
jgi:hypothetical protein